MTSGSAKYQYLIYKAHGTKSEHLDNLSQHSTNDKPHTGLHAHPWSNYVASRRQSPPCFQASRINRPQTPWCLGGNGEWIPIVRSPFIIPNNNPYNPPPFPPKHQGAKPYALKPNLPRARCDGRPVLCLKSGALTPRA